MAVLNECVEQFTATVRAYHQFVSICVLSTDDNVQDIQDGLLKTTTSYHEGIEDSQVSTMLSFSSQLLVSARFRFPLSST